jgi:xanthine permease XanP
MSGHPLLRLPASSIRRRQPDLAYCGTERPPATILLALAAQHCATALTFITFVIAVAVSIGLSPVDTQLIVTGTILAMALGTFLQAWGRGVGGGIFLVHFPSIAMAILVAGAVKTMGVGALPAIGLASGISALLVSNLIPRLRALFPPAVAGVVVAVAGMSISKPALLHATGLDEAGLIHADSLVVSGLTLLVIVGLSVWGSRLTRIFALLGGLAAGVLASWFQGTLPDATPLVGLPVFALPALSTVTFDVRPEVLLAFALLAALMQLDTFGVTVLMQRMEDADWRRPGMKGVGGAIRAVGVTHIVGGVLGGFPTGVSTANVALCSISAATSRYIGLAVAAGLLTIALLPQFAMMLTMLPQPVIGAVEIYAAAYLTVAGIGLIMSRAMDIRGIFTVGLSLFVAVAAIAFPELVRNVPQAVRFLFESPVLLAGGTALLLNLTFRLGSSRRARLELDAIEPSEVRRAVIDYVGLQGASWGARPEVIQRAGNAAVEAIDSLTGAGERTVLSVQTHFDEFNFDVELSHDGPALLLGEDGAGDAPEDDPLSIEAIERAVARASIQLLRHFSDSVTTGGDAGRGWIRLHLEH